MARPSRRSRGSVTIEDVARAAGVSAMTVSRVMNGEKNVRDSTREAVREAIERLKYTPNTAARSLAAGQATHIGLLYANPSDAYLSQFLVGALEGARRAGCHLVIEACEYEHEAEQAEAARRFATTQVEGVILPPPLSESVPILTELAAAEMPVVTVAMGHLYENALNIRIDDFAAAAEMTHYLLSLGHRRIGLIKGFPTHIASIERERGFKAALEAEGVDPSEAPIEQGYFTFRSGLAAAERLLDLPDPPTAIFASNDDMAAAAVSVAHRRGLAVPDDISIVGFDDTAPATTVWPELTTVRQPVSAMAEAALDLLLADLRGRRSGMATGPAEQVLEHELVIRESSGPASIVPKARRTA
ncbi:MAG TPA: LacI family DNA-binding transcriptional regulator [Allosphingosinicella sp.]|nr:LacI family DNA-binding transcriptional regulator [Allosphingosinicella sp.]